METKVKRREWVKTAAIVFLSVLLVLTFFSNTIMNHSLPEVAAQYVESGTINARIRGSGTVSANEVYSVTLSQTRKVNSVLVKVGQEVAVGDPLVRLESRESEELKAAQDTLDQMELSYQKSLIEASNSASTEDREIQKLREDYDEALRIYRIYSNVNPDQVEIALKEAEQYLAILERKVLEDEAKLEAIKSSPLYVNAQAEIAALQSNLDSANAQLAAAESVLNEFNDVILKETEVGYKYGSYTAALDEYNKFISYAGRSEADIELSSNNLEFFIYRASQNGHILDEESAKMLQKAYRDVAPIIELREALPSQENAENEKRYAEAMVEDAEEKLRDKKTSIEEIEQEIQLYENEKNGIPNTRRAIAEQKSLISELTEASSAATTLKSAEEALEDALFQASLGDSANLDMQAAKEAIDEQKKLVEELTVEADGQEITASVTGTVTAINVSAGATAAAEQPIVEITVADRGYTLPISVTTEQARQVRVGDAAEITNYYWGDITATLENIANDPQSMGKNKMLIFRIEGEGVEAGTNLTLSIGQRSANYDCLVPNSAVRSDSNGSFVLVVEAKSSPLGNRYVATRADVQVLASDDTTSAVSGLSNGDFVITTSNKPLEAGELVRLPDNG